MNEKTKIYLILSVAAAISILLVVFTEPVKIGWWIFSEYEMPYRYFAGAALLVATFYLFTVVWWYSGKTINAKKTFIAFLICGGISDLIVFFLYWGVDIIALKEIEVVTGWWIFKTTSMEYSYSNPIFEFLCSTGIDAGIVEEPAKLLALLLVPSVRRAIVDRQTGIYYAVLCALGFEMIENIFYFWGYNEVILGRTVPPAHAVFSAIWGAAYGSWVAKEISTIKMLKYMLYGIGLHGLWNFSIEVDPFFFLVIFIGVAWFGYVFVKKELKVVRPVALARAV